MPLIFYDCLKNRLNAATLRGVVRQENHAHAVDSRPRQVKTSAAADLSHKCMRYLKQNSGAVAGFRLAADPAPMVQVAQNSQRLEQYLVRFLAFYIDDEAYTAGIMLKLRIIKALSFRQTIVVHTLHPSFKNCL